MDVNMSGIRHNQRSNRRPASVNGEIGEARSCGRWTKARWLSQLKELMKYNGDMLEEKHGSIMIVATLIASTVFQTAVNPPGGVWQENAATEIGKKFYSGQNSTTVSGLLSCIAPFNITTDLTGTAVLATLRPIPYLSFLFSSIFSLTSSILVILLLVSGFPHKNKICMFLMTTSLCASLITMANAFYMAMILVAPKSILEQALKYITVSTYVWMSFLGIICIFYVGRFLRWAVDKFRRN